jgi:ABC-2 type transport system permease protein
MYGNDTLRLFLYCAKHVGKSRFQYKVDACLRSFAVFAREATNVVVICLTLMTFPDINGWKPGELMFMFSLLFATYGILIIFFTGLRDFDETVRSGNFDRYLLRPRGLLFQIIASDSDWFAAIGHGGLGVFLFLLSASRIGIHWRPATAAYYFAAIVGGVLIQGAIFLGFAALSFRFIKTESLREVAYWNVRKFAVYPISVFPKFIQGIMIYVVPFAFVNYFPAQFMLRKQDMAQYPECFLYITPIVGVSLLALAYSFWKASLRQYQSSGN